MKLKSYSKLFVEKFVLYSSFFCFYKTKTEYLVHRQKLFYTNMLKKTSLLNKALAFIFFLLAIFLIAKYKAIVPILTDFTEQHIQTSTGVILENQIFILELTLIFFILLCLLITVVLLFNLHKRFFYFFNNTFDSKKLKKTFYTDKKIASKTYAKRVFLISTLYAILMHLKLLLTGDPKQETIFEHLNSLLFFLSAIVLFITLKNVKTLKAKPQGLNIIRTWLVLCATALLFIFLEEISYGQHFFGWEASGVFKENNFQSETNLHNFINPLFRFLYPAAGIGMFTILYLLWFYYKGKKPIWLEFLTPHKNLFVLVFFMACVSYIGHTETFEEMLSLFTLLYSLRLLLWIKRLKTDSPQIVKASTV